MRVAVILLSAAVVTGVSVSRAADGPAPPSDQDRVQGWWACQAALMNGKPLEDPGNSPPVRISGNRVESVGKGPKDENAPKELFFTMDPAQDPKTVDIHWLAGDKKITCKGIYVLDKDELRVAVMIGSDDKPFAIGVERPTSFTAAPPKGRLVLVYVFRRAKAPKEGEETEAATEKEEKHYPPPSIAYNGFGAVALSPDGKWVAAGGRPGTTVRLWDVATGKETAALPGHDSEVRMVAFSRDGKRLFTATAAEVRTWELTKGKQLQRIPAGPGTGAHQLTLSGDERWFVSEPENKADLTPDGKNALGAIRLWEVEKGKEVRRFRIVRTTGELLGQYLTFFAEGKGSDAIIGTALSHDGKRVVGGTEHGEVHLWDTETGKKIRTFERSWDIGASPVGFSKDGKWLAVSVMRPPPHGKGDWRASVVIWDVATGEVEQVVRGGVFDRSMTEDGQWLITGCEEKSVRLWDVETGEEIGVFAGHDDPVQDCFVSGDKKRLVTLDRGGVVRLWEISTGKMLRTIQARDPADRDWPYPNFNVRIDGDAKVLVAWTPARLTLWDLESGKAIRSVERPISLLGF